MAEKMKPLEQFLTAKEKMKQSLIGVDFKDLDNKKFENLKVFLLEVTDKNKWNSPENVKALTEEFGEIIYNEFGEKDVTHPYNKTDPKIYKEMIDYMADGDLNDADKIIVISDQERLVGFYAYKYIPNKNDQKVIYECLGAIDHHYQNKAYFKKILELFFKEENPDVLIGQSCTPVAIKLIINEGKKFGYETFFCGNKNGRLGDKGSANEQGMVKEFTEIAVAEHQRWAIESDVPYGYVVGKKEVCMPPFNKQEIKFSESDPLKEIFEKEFIPIQERNYPHTLFGILVTFK